MKPKTNLLLLLWLLIVSILTVGCRLWREPVCSSDIQIPATYTGRADSVSSACIRWRTLFTDTFLIALIDTALKNNQDLLIVLHDIEIARNEIKAKKGEYLPFLNIAMASSLQKAGYYTPEGVLEENLKMDSGGEFPKPLSNFEVHALFSWEWDIWGKLRNARKAAMARYLATVEGKNFLITQLVSEIASEYYRLLALDNQLIIVEKNIILQTEALQIIKQQKEAARVTQLAVNRFEAQLLHTESLLYEIKQQIAETERRINYLTGGFPGSVPRRAESFEQPVFKNISVGSPADLLTNRPDIRQAFQELESARCAVASAKAALLPSFHMNISAGLQSFTPSTLMNPLSLAYHALTDMLAPLLNRNAFIAELNIQKARHQQASLKTEQTIIKACNEMSYLLAAIDNYSSSYATKSKEVTILTRSIQIANNLFMSARADYLEVLLTQKEALESRMELIDIRKNQLLAEIYTYKALGGGWQ